MNVRVTLALSTLLLAPQALAHAQAPAAGPSGGPATQLHLTQKTEAPGISLSAGTYAVRVEDRLKDRVIVQVQKAGSNSFVSLLSFPNPSINTGRTGPITFASGLKSKPTLRGFAFPGGPTVEFIYPKGDAVTLAKANDVRVMAVDPGSEGMVSLPHLNQTDMAEVTLWMLTPTPVDPGTSKPGIQAARYQAPEAPSATSGTQTAANQPAPVPVKPQPQPVYRASTQPAPTRRITAPPAVSSNRAPVEVASNNRPHRLRPDVKALPHTASNQPLIFLVGLLSLGGASLLTARRTRMGLRA